MVRVSVFVHQGQPGAELASEMAAVAVVVDALRASGTLTTLLAFGAGRVLVVGEPEEAFALREALGGDAILVGERDGIRIDGFDLGNEPLRRPQSLSETCIFTSSNCSACCLAAAGARELLVGSPINARATAAAIELLARDRPCIFVPAGFSSDPTRFSLEDYLACGAIIHELARISDVELANDGAKAAVYLYRYVGPERLEREFLASEHGVHLVSIGRRQDVEHLAKLNLLDLVPRRTSNGVVEIGGVRAVELAGWTPPGL